MNITIDFKGLIRQYVAPHRRKANRLRWLWALTDLQGTFDSFAAWRDHFRYKVHVTSQHKSLEGHLNKVFGEGIIVRSYNDQFLDIGLDTEPAHWVVFDPTPEVALEGESGRSFDGVDFIVYAPDGVDIPALSAEIERYKLADKVYKIVTRTRI